jgi:hypothetical protein
MPGSWWSPRAELLDVGRVAHVAQEHDTRP